MFRIFTGIVLLLWSCGLAAAEPCNVAGDWDGALEARLLLLHLTFHIDADGRGTMTSIDQGNKTLPLSAVTCQDYKAAITVGTIGSFSGALSADGQKLAGVWQQGAGRLPLSLNRRQPGQAGYVRKRPQEPHPPYPYRSEDITFAGPGGITLAGTLTRPQGNDRVPAVILIQGSGAHDRNEEIFGHKPFLVLADWLTRHGVAVLRTDKRGVGQSTGDVKTATTFDFVADAKAAVAYLRSRPEIDRRRIGLIGHSEGGMIAPVVAAGDKSIAFIVLLAGPGLRGDDLLVLQRTALMRAKGVPDVEAAKYADQFRQLITAMEKISDPAERKTAGQAVLARLAPHLSEASRAEMIDGVNTPWMMTMLTFDPSVYLKKVTCPVLALNGEKDLQVLPKENLAAIKAALANNRDVEIVPMPGLNHLFQTASSGLPAEYGEIEETIAPAALQKMTDWIVRHSQ